MTTRARKTEQVEELTDALSRAPVVVVTDYRGFSVGELGQIRSTLRSQQVTYMVAKNSLTRLAAAKAGLPELGPLLEGPTALAFLFGEFQGPARSLAELATARKPLIVKGLIVGKKPAGAPMLQQLATMPAREQLYAQVVGGIASPLTGLLGVLQGVVASLGYLLQARVQQLGGEPPEAA